MAEIDYSYWSRQDVDKPLYGDIAWSRPEQKAHAGRLAIVGGSQGTIAAVAAGYDYATKTGAGAVRVLLPDALKKTIPPTITEVIYAPSNPSGSLAREAGTELRAIGDWAEAVLLIGDAGRNSETAIIYEEFMGHYDGPLTITRDAADLLKNAYPTLVEREKTLLVLSFAQLQKLFSSVYYPKVLTFSMQLTNLVEAIHKFTITYPIAIMVLHNGQMIMAEDGKVSSTPFGSPMSIWRGEVATKAACYWLWNPGQVFKAATTSLVADTPTSRG